MDWQATGHPPQAEQNSQEGQTQETKEIKAPSSCCATIIRQRVFETKGTYSRSNTSSSLLGLAIRLTQQ